VRAPLLLLAIALASGCSRTPAELVRLGPATAVLGSPDAEVGRDGDEARHEAAITRPFLLGRHEVSRGEWRRVLGELPPGRDTWSDDHPATVSWNDAVRYCNARSAREGLRPAYTAVGPEVRWDRSADGYRLPTEAEWSLAARSEGGPRGGDARCGDPDADGPRPVARGAANADGFHDLIGNVEEWVFDRYAGFAPGATTDPIGPPEGALRVARGGSYSDDPRHCRPADRSAFAPDRRLDSLGFRVARSIR
jgi:sulfatase modifying factor 1